MQRWACLFVFSAVSNDRLDELRTTIEDCDVVWMFADYKHALEAFRPIKDAIKGKTLVLYREMVNLGLVSERILELKVFIEEIGSAADRIVIHYPRHRIVWDAELERFETVRAGLVVPYVFVMNFATKRQLRFVHYQTFDKYWKGSDIVDKLKHLPHVIVGGGPGAVGMRFIEVMRLQAASELIVHPTRIDSFSRFILHGILLHCVPVLMLTDAELPFIYANATSTDKLAAFRELSKYFLICPDEDSFIATVEHLFAHPDEIQEYRTKVLEFLLHNRDLWCPEIIYETFAERDLFLPSDPYPAAQMTNVGIDAFPSGKWSKNPTSKLFRQPITGG
jgi:hypothetical protein